MRRGPMTVIVVAAFVWLLMLTVGLPIYFHVTARPVDPGQWAFYEQQVVKWNNSAGVVACAHARDEEACFGSLEAPARP